MKFLGQNEIGEYVFYFKRNEFLSINYALMDGAYIDFEKKIEVQDEFAKKFYLTKIQPCFEKQEDCELALVDDELFIFTWLLTKDALDLGIDCYSLTGTTFEEIYYIVFVLLQILRDVQFTGISEEAIKYRQSCLDEIAKTLQTYKISINIDIFDERCALGEKEKQELIKALNIKKL